MASLMQGLDSQRPILTAEPVSLPYDKDSKWSRCLALSIDSVLSQSECNALIDITSKAGYEAACIDVGGGKQVVESSVRKSGRCIIDDPKFAVAVWERISSLIPKTYEGPGGQWEPVGLNERMRFLRYQPGDYFKPHQDGSFARNDGPGKGERSFLTLMLYLDEPGSGGETKFLNPQLKTETSVHPRGGLGLVFDHELLHEGATLIAGVKHALRTDVMYRRVQGKPIKFASLEEMLSLRRSGRV